MDADAPGRGTDLHGATARLRADGRLPSLQKLTTRFGSYPSRESYPAVGSFTRYVRETWGFDTLRAVWDGGHRALPEATGTDLETLEAGWLDAVAAATR